MSQTTFELKRKLLQLEALHDVGRAINTLRPEGELLEEIVQRAAAILDASSGFVVSLDENLQLQHDFSIGLVLDPDRILEEQAVKDVLGTRVAQSSNVETFLGRPGGALLIAPIVAGDVLLGFVGVLGKESRGSQTASFVEEDLRFLTSLCAIVGAAVANSREFHRLSRERENLENENRSLRARMFREYSDRLMIGESPAMQRVIDLIARVSESPASVMIRGESGTGKEMVARLIHGNSPRRDKAFVAINCAAIPETLLEAELFGIERGVATGVEARPGKFEIANGGTVFLDEIGDIPLTLQAKLLRVVQEREVEKLGGRRKLSVDVRILCATHRDLEKMIEEGTFRPDLYYRLRVVEITLPPLRERKEDIPKLVRYFLDKYAPREKLQDVRIDQRSLQKIMRYSFPGNVRELENLIEGALALTVDAVIDPSDLLMPETDPGGMGDLLDDYPDLRELERRYIRRVLEHTTGNMSQAAKILGVDRKTLYRRRDEMSQEATVDAKRYIQ